MRARRRQGVAGLGGAVLFLVLAAAILGGWAWAVAGLAGAAYGGYVTLVLTLERRARQRDLVVRRLQHGTGVGQPRPDGGFSLSRRRAS